VPRRFSIRAQLVAAFVTVALVPVAALGADAYRSERSLVERGALSQVRVVASARLQVLQFYVARSRSRAAGFVEKLASTCPAASDRAACLRAELDGFVRNEGARAAELRVPGAPPIVTGEGGRALEVEPGALARLRRDDTGALSMVTDARDAAGTHVLVERSARPIEDAFQERFGLGDSGETFLADANGFFLTSGRYPSSAGHSHSIDARPMLRCLAGEADAMVAPDYRGVIVIHGFRPVPEIGGGCVMAHIDFQEAMRPARALRDHALGVAAVAAAVASAVAALLAWLIAAPLERLAGAVRSMEGGDFDVKVRPGYTSAEVGTLVTSFGRLGRAIRATVALEAEQARRVEAERAEARQRLLADASTILSSSLEDDAQRLSRFVMLVASRLEVRCGVRRAKVEDETIAGEPSSLDPFAPQPSSAPGAALQIPLEAGDVALGTFAIARAGDGATLEEHERTLANELGARLAVALEQARLYAAVREAVSARETFIAIASHELRTPLTALKLQLDALARRGGAKADLDRRLPILERQVARLIALVDGLLDVERIARGAFLVERTRVDLAAVAREASERFQPELARAGCRFELRADDPVVGRWDALRIEQIVLNLLSNAAKYGAGKPIELAVERIGARALLSVRDGGIGIREDQQARIFERFERAVSERNFGGLGLGLWITREIVHALGGTIAVTSAAGAGASFVVELPIEIESEGPHPMSPSASTGEGDVG
jgi:signal transduction histidine kinase/HAMP domain-containing protein